MKDFLKYILGTCLILILVGVFEFVLVGSLFVALLQIDTWWGDSLALGWLIFCVVFQLGLIYYFDKD